MRDDRMTGSMRLLQPYNLGALELPNRVVMAPMTRNRAGKGDAPTEMNATYYRQRASAGLIITEATKVSAGSIAYPRTPGVYTQEQMDGWSRVAEAVHGAGGRIFLQLWHGGRISHSSIQPAEQLPVAPSAIAASGEAATWEGKKPFETPRALETDEVAGIVEQFGGAARAAQRAGMDGIELHGANGYLIDQFLRDGANRREDRYGGSVENRARFLLEVVDAVVSVLSADRVGVRFSPAGTFNSMSDSAPVELYDYVLAELSKRGIGYVHTVEPGPGAEGAGPGAASLNASHIRSRFNGTLITAGGYDRDSGNAVLAAGDADLVAYARLFISNPDLPERFANHTELTEPDAATFYGGKEKGYIDYPALGDVTVA